MSAESDARRLADIRSWRTGPYLDKRRRSNREFITMHIEDIDLLLRIADERDQLRRDLCEEQEGRDRRPTEHADGSL